MSPVHLRFLIFDVVFERYLKASVKNLCVRLSRYLSRDGSCDGNVLLIGLVGLRRYRYVEETFVGNGEITGSVGDVSSPVS